MPRKATGTGGSKTAAAAGRQKAQPLPTEKSQLTQDEVTAKKDVPTLDIKEQSKADPEGPPVWHEVPSLSDAEITIEAANITSGRYPIRNTLLRVRKDGELTGQLIFVPDVIYHHAAKEFVR